MSSQLAFSKEPYNLFIKNNVQLLHVLAERSSWQLWPTQKWDYSVNMKRERGLKAFNSTYILRINLIIVYNKKAIEAWRQVMIIKQRNKYLGYEMAHVNCSKEKKKCNLLQFFIRKVAAN